MSEAPKNVLVDSFQLLMSDYASLGCAEERLSWLLERSPEHHPLDESYCTPERRIPGCISGLWLACQVQNGLLFFQAKSESAMVQGVVSFLCDLYSRRSPREVCALGRSLADELGLAGLLTITRRRAVESTVSFFLAAAGESNHPHVAEREASHDADSQKHTA